jgi:hypothetical protein
VCTAYCCVDGDSDGDMDMDGCKEPTWFLYHIMV